MMIKASILLSPNKMLDSILKNFVDVVKRHSVPTDPPLYGIYPERPTPLKFCLEDHGHIMLSRRLPTNLLSKENPFRPLTREEIQKLGPYALYLTEANAGCALPLWILALSNGIQAVSVHKRMTPNNACILLAAIGLSKARLRCINIACVQFSLRDTSFFTLSIRLLWNALHQSAFTLREMRVAVANESAEVLEQLTFPTLERVCFTVIAEMAQRVSSNLLGRMFRALEYSSVTCICLEHLSCAPFLSSRSKFYSSAVLTRVDVLKIQNLIYSGDLNEGYRKMASFISLFPNLKQLAWSGCMSNRHVAMVLEACENLHSVRLNLDFDYANLSSQEKTISSLTANCRDFRELQLLLGEASDDLASITYVPELHPLGGRQIDWLCMYNRLLRSVTIHIDTTALPNLPTLCARCRLLERLDVKLFSDTSLSSMDWMYIREIARNAPRTLRDFLLRAPAPCVIIEQNMAEVLGGIESVFIAMGENARRIEFTTVVSSVGMERFLYIYTRLLRMAAAYTPNLQCLDLRLAQSKTLYKWIGGDTGARSAWHGLHDAYEEMLEKTPQLWRLCTAGWIRHAQSRCRTSDDELYASAVETL